MPAIIGIALWVVAIPLLAKAQKLVGWNELKEAKRYDGESVLLHGLAMVSHSDILLWEDVPGARDSSSDSYIEIKNHGFSPERLRELHRHRLTVKGKLDAGGREDPRFGLPIVMATKIETAEEVAELWPRDFIQFRNLTGRHVKLTFAFRKGRASIFEMLPDDVTEIIATSGCLEVTDLETGAMETLEFSIPPRHKGEPSDRAYYFELKSGSFALNRHLDLTELLAPPDD